MKAVLVKAFALEQPMALEDVPDPSPGPGQLLVRVGAAGVNPLEIAIRSGNNRRAKTMQLPYVCGSDVAGEIEAVGEGVEEFSPGDRVWGRSVTGAYAERGLLPAAMTGRLPAACSFSEGAALPIPMLTAWNALVIKAQVGPGEVVLVQGGAGGVGYLAIQLARHMGCRVLATVSSKEKADFCIRAGADGTINYREDDVTERVMELTGGRGADVVVELSASDNLGVDVTLVAPHGRVVIVGTGTGKGPEARLNVAAAMTRDARILALSSANLAPHVPDVLRRLEPLLASGAIKAHVSRELPLDRADEAHQIVLSGKFLGKVVLVP